MSFDGLDYNRSSTYKKLEDISGELIKMYNIPAYYSGLICRVIAHKQQHLLKLVKQIRSPEQLN